MTAASVRDFTITPLYLLTVQSSRSGLVIAGSKPNTTPYTFTMVAGEIVTLTAPPAPMTNFVRWKDAAGNTLTHCTDLAFVAVADQTVIAEYKSGIKPRDYYVNDEAPEDGFAAGNDDNDGLSAASPVRHIQQILDRDDDIATIHVAAGHYFENLRIDAGDSDMTLLGAGPGATILDGNQAGPCVLVNSARNVAIRGFTIRNGSSDTDGGGIAVQYGSVMLANVVITGNSARLGGGLYLLQGSLTTIRDCVFAGNIAADRGGAIACSECAPAITNCTLAGNIAASGGGLYSEGAASPVVRNCILWDNQPDPVSGSASPAVSFSDIQGGWLAGTGNISADPLLTDPACRIDPASPCRDAGDPTFAAVAGQRDIEGHARQLNGRIDIGADEYSVRGDLDGDGRVDVVDLLTFATNWGRCAGDGGYALAADLNADSSVNVVDLLILAGHWGV